MKKIIFITGIGRSGSTLLDRMLGNNPQGFSVGEVNALFRPWKRKHLLRDSNCFCNKPNCNFWKKIKTRKEKNLYDTIFNLFKNINYIVDSSKSPLWIRDQIKYNQNKNYDIKIVCIYKTPQEFFYSMKKRGKSKLWKIMWKGRYMQLFNLFTNFLSIKYSDLTRNPKDTLRHLCESLDIEYYNEQEKYWNNPNQHSLFGSSAVRDSKSIFYDNLYKESFNYSFDSQNSTIRKIFTLLEKKEIIYNNSKVKIFHNKRSNTYHLLFSKLINTPYYQINKINFLFFKYLREKLINKKYALSKN